MDRIANIAAAIIGVALVTTVVSRSNSARVIGSVGDAFSKSLNVAMGRG